MLKIILAGIILHLGTDACNLMYQTNVVNATILMGALCMVACDMLATIFYEEE